MGNDFRIVLFKQNAEEGTLLVQLNSKKNGQQFYTNVLSFNRLKNLADDLINKDQNYFYKKNVLVVKELTEHNLQKIVRELDDSGDFFEIMQPLTVINKIIFQWKYFLSRIFQKK